MALVLVVVLVFCASLFFAHFKADLVQITVTLGRSEFTLFVPRFTRAEPVVASLDALQAVSGLLAAIFSIAFGLSQFIVAGIADRYSPQMLDFFRRSLKYKVPYFVIFTSLVVSIAAFLYVNQLNGYLQFIMATILTTLSAASVVSMSVYYLYLYEIVNPLAFTHYVERLILSSSGRADLSGMGSTALADSAIKAIHRRGEDGHTKSFLDSLARIAIAVRSQPVFGSVLDDMIRIQEAATKEQDTKITEYIFSLMQTIGAEIV
jgi:MFS family permease